MCIGLHAKYVSSFSDYNDTSIFRTDLRKVLKYRISRISTQWQPSCFMRTDRRRDRQMDGETGKTKPIASFPNFTKAPK